MFVIAYLTVLAIDTLAIAYLIRRGLSRNEQPPTTATSWFDTARFRHGLTDTPAAGVVDRVRASRGVIVHPCSAGGDLIEYPLHADFSEDDVLETLAEIESL